MLTRTAKLIALIGLLVIGGLVSFVRAADDNVTVLVKDRANKNIPFATVNINNQTNQTGPNGESARFTLENGQYLALASHPYIINKRAEEVEAKKKFKLAARKLSAHITLKLKGVLPTDSSGPALTQISPTSSDQLMAGEPITFRIAANDAETRVAMVRAVLNGQPLDPPVMDSELFTWVVPSLPDGQQEIVYQAWNFVGTTTINNWRFQVNPRVGQLAGQITFNDQPVTDATVRLDTGQNAATDNSGHYTINSVRSGNRLVTVAAPGLTTKAVNVSVIMDRTNTLDIDLVDGVAPATPSNLAVVNTNPTATKQTVSWDAVADRSGVSYEVNQFVGSTIQATKISSTTAAIFEDLNPNTEYTYAVQAKDGAAPANSSGWSSNVKKTTQQLPAISWIQPVANQNISSIVELRASYQVFGVGNLATRVELVLTPNTNLGSVAPNNQNGTVVLNWDTATSTNGAKTLRAAVTDAEGNGRQTEVNIQVNNPGAVNGVISFNGSPINNATVRLNTGQSTTTNPNGQYAINGLAEGNYQIIVSAAGLSDKTEPLTIGSGQTVTLNIAMIDGVAPPASTGLTVTNIRPTASKQEVVWNASIDISGIKEYEIQRLNGSTLIETKTTAGTSIVFDGLADNTDHSYRVRAKDNADNLGNFDIAVTKRTQRMPMIQWAAPLANQNLRDSVTLTVNYWVFSASPSQLQWQVDSSIIATSNPANASAQVSVLWDTRTVSNGPKTLRVIVVDAEDNLASADLVENIANPNTLTGIVSEQGSSTAVTDATIEVRNGPNLIKTANADASGAYQLTEIVDGTYSVRIWAEGYQDTTINNVQLTGGTTTLNGTMVLLPLVTLDGTVRELAGPGGSQFLAPYGLAIKGDGSELIIGESGPNNVNFYNPSTEVHFRTVNISPGSGHYLAYDNTGFLAARFGHSTWVSDDGSQSAGPILGFHGLATHPNGNIYMVDTDFMRRFINRTQSPAGGYDMRNITGGDHFGVSVNENSIFIITATNKLVRLAVTDPLDSAKHLTHVLDYMPSQISYVPGTRSLLIAEANSNRLHVHDSRTLVEYASITIPANFANGGGVGLAVYREDNKNIKIFTTTLNIDRKVYIIRGLVS